MIDVKTVLFSYVITNILIAVFMALLVLEKHRGPLDLLLTDVIMPSMTGLELKERVETLHPGIKTLFMSGYTAEVIAQRGLLEEGPAFIKKPFTVEGLVGKVRGVLDG